MPTVFFYEYDFGDSWGHELRVEKVSKPNPRFSYPRCLAGARACPSEDCGGPPGYHALVEEVAAARFERRLGRRGDRSCGDDDDGDPARLFDPGRFDLERINKQLGGAPRRHERRPELGLEEPDAIRGAFAQQVRGACSMVREALLTSDVETLSTAQHAYLTTMLGLLARVGVPERVDPALAQAALAEIRSPEVAPALHELQDLGERLRQHINRIDGPRHRPRRNTRA